MDASGPAISTAIPDKVCDIVLKGGITSGVVYPLALVELSKKFRFSNIGGTSAGAIAAAAAAAAEYGRTSERGGFRRIERIPGEIGPKLLSLFQPAPKLKPLFDIFVAALGSKNGLSRATGIVCAVLKSYPLDFALGGAPGLVIAILAWAFGNLGFIVCGLILALLGVIGVIAYRLFNALRFDLADNDYGICPGIGQTGATSEAFTDWLARLIDEAAGFEGNTDEPLTFGKLAAPPDGRPPITLAMMTTSLMERRPYTLPIQDDRFVFKKSEWEKLFPKRIVDYLVKTGRPFDPPGKEEGEFYYLPDEDVLPVIVGVRMSLSFPGLISAVPLWRRDFSYAEEADRNRLRRCLFSDGGLSSNFPIHFFDRLLPNTPTFAISLDPFVEERKRPDRVWLPKSAQSGLTIPVEPFSGLPGFLMRLVDSAKDWQDHLQATLPGYRERIVHVGLKPDEGGLNLTMDETTITKLTEFGRDAGRTLGDDFDLDEHRWRRFLVAMSRIEQSLDEIAEAYDGSPGTSEAFGKFLDRYAAEAESYEQDSVIRQTMLERCLELADLGRRWRERPRMRDGRIPKPETTLRISPRT